MCPVRYVDFARSSSYLDPFCSSNSWFDCWEIANHMLSLGDNKSVVIYVEGYPVRLHVFGDRGLVCIDNSIIRFKLAKSEIDAGSFRSEEFVSVEDLTYSSLNDNWVDERVRLAKIETHLSRLCWGTWYIGNCEENLVISHG